MARRAFRPGAARISQKRLSSWFQFQPLITTVTAVGGTIAFTFNTAALELRPFTIVRTRFLLGIISDQIVTSETQIAAVGLAIVSDEAAAVGVTAVPTLIDNMASDLWFVHQLLYNEHTNLTSVGYADGGQQQYEVDSKAMRKVDIGQNLVVVVELSGNSGGGAEVMIGGRMLVKVN